MIGTKTINGYIKRLRSLDRESLQQDIELRVEKARDVFEIIVANDLAKIGMVLLAIFLIVGLFAPVIAPHEPNERQTNDQGDWLRGEDPSITYPMGTTDNAHDIFSQVVFGTRVALMAGMLTALMVGGLGTFAGIIAGYSGGYTETAIMRIVDLAYGVPFLPFAIVLVIVLGANLWNIVLAISLILWRETARVVRSEVLSIRELADIESAKASGASDTRIILYHIFPKVLPTAVLYSVFAIGWAILAEAGLSFLGFSDHEMVSWGSMLQAAYNGQALDQSMWWWIFPPGICISLLVISVYLISQGIEEVVNPHLREV
ncbi:ABC transporter permease [Halalkalirubrum salinum]|uniref:ABC transporter permease n=1 Tax=Halalkalirubrum salinum TaxID=2563889 RepID=UPI001485BAAD|nr:ABC transporter permease [Halalkalirubrum salinum]